jgi:hypothetical protein
MTADRYVPVYDGKAPVDPDAVAVLVPTRANFDALIGDGQFGLAIELMISRLAAAPIDHFRSRGVTFVFQNAAATPLTDAQFLTVARDQAWEWVNAESGPTPDDWRAFSIFRDAVYLSGFVEADKETQVAVLAALTLGYASAGLGGEHVAEIFADAEAARGIKPGVSDFARKGQAAGVVARTPWRTVAIDILRPRLEAKKWMSHNDAAKILEEADHAPKFGGLGLPDRRQVAAWIGAERRKPDGALPAKTRRQ